MKPTISVVKSFIFFIETYSLLIFITFMQKNNFLLIFDMHLELKT
jgi:hypothetical protein